ncbi:MAG TPA: AMP-binding protein [Solirubrobacteraceae bacterium]|nr:AMP-binding protein [Solirubrobacteraceae bacterium]
MHSWLHRARARHSDRTAIEGPGRSLSYAELAEEAQRAAGAFSIGQRVPLANEDRLEFAIALHGCLLAQAAAVPIDLRLSRAEQAERVASGMATERAEVATVMHTSGTTSAPKPVELTYANWEANALGSAVMLGLDQQERWLCVMPLAHVGGLSILLRSTIYATTAVVHERFDTEAVLNELMDPHRAISLVSLVPTMLARLLDAGLRRPPTLRWALLGGGPIPAPLLERAQAAVVPVAPTYGMTEGCSQIATYGLPLPGVELRTVEGELWVRGPIVAPGALAEDGWLHTGDLADLDGDGRLTIIGRASETIVSGGENVAPAEVEAALLEHPAVAEAGVFARPDAEWGEAVTARVVLRDGSVVTEEVLRDWCRSRLAAFKVPKQVEFARDLPRTVSGKLLRRQLS